MSEACLYNDMSSKSVHNTHRRAQRRQSTPTAERIIDCPTETVIELFGDEYTRAALDAVTETARSGREVSEYTAMSRPTAFRRLNQLEKAGFVTSEQRLDDDGNHHKRYRSRISTLSIQLTDDGLVTTVIAASQREQQQAGFSVRAED